MFLDTKRLDLFDQTIQRISSTRHGRVVAIMLAHGEARLLTANRGDFRRFEPRIEIVGL